ncbi:hypothetical protein FIV42_16455 [Persicimonas caeni]|uniref:Immunity 49 family protein n=1 Tax=Persicimonas caeni TaxID=2292766 RepID=A0A4Y6PVA0_PERCE|nr:immunity 49 family protein [Persicimonas caeni]QDG52271.1 hypothetical protein FIV42_16455 [Persicimonas caeni]QED33493.1 hypothetical protein FRD00_16450 [Persicimonas caeni]
MARIDRHQNRVWLAELEVEELSEMLDDSFSIIRQIPRLTSLNSIQHEARSLAAFQSVLDPKAPEIRMCFISAARAIAGLYHCAQKEEGTVEVELGDGGAPVVFEATGINALTHDGTWQTGFHLAAILRDRELMDLLCTFTTDQLRQAPGVTSEPFFYPFVEALRGYWAGDPNTAMYLAEAMELTEPERLVMANPDAVLHRAVPWMEVFFRLLEHDQKAFNDALVKALELHKAYWGSETADRADDIEGILALELCSMAALAYEQDIEIQVESDYIPGWLVRGEVAQQD